MTDQGLTQDKHFKYPYSDAKLSSYQISSDGRAVGLMCVALNGFHSDECKYSWSIGVGGIPIPNESYPVPYTGVVGKYVCTLCVEHYKDVRVFNITSEFQCCALYYNGQLFYAGHEGQKKVEIDTVTHESFGKTERCMTDLFCYCCI